MIKDFRTSLFWSSGDRDGRRDRVCLRGPFVALLSGLTNSNAAGTGPFENAVDLVEEILVRQAWVGDRCDRFPRREDVRTALALASRRVAAFDQTLPDHLVVVSALVLWVSTPGQIEIARCGGGSVYCIRDGAVITLSSACTRPHPAEAPCFVGATTALGLDAPSIEMTSHVYRESDRIVALSHGADSMHDDHVRYLRAAARCRHPASTLAPALGERLLAKDSSRDFAVIAIEPAPPRERPRTVLGPRIGIPDLGGSTELRGSPGSQPGSVRADICVDVGDADQLRTVIDWFARWRDHLRYVSDDRGCGCCVNAWTVDGPDHAIAELPSSVRA